MDIKDLKTQASKIKMPAEMRERIIRNCYEQKIEDNKSKRKIFKKPFALAATIALCVCLTSITAFAASSGLFTSIKKAFYNDDNALRASEPSEYAFIPNVDSINGDGVTLNVTEAIADSHGLRIFMDMIFENGIPLELLDYSKSTLDGIGFENYEPTNEGVMIGLECVSIENNIISLYMIVGGIQENEWEKNGFAIGVENFGYYPGPGGFIKISDISGKINIPPEQIKINHSVTAYSDIDGVKVKMELSLLGINMTFDSAEDYFKIEDKISDHSAITPCDIGVYMKDGTIYGKGNNMDKAGCMLDGGMGAPHPDGTYHRYISFNMPIDIENIEKITFNDYEFCFE